MTETRSQPAAYAPIVRLLHWLVALLVLIEFALGWTMPRVSDNTLPTGLMSWHLSVGAALLAMMLVRVVCRLIYEPESSPTTPLRPWSRVTHLSLYVALFAVLVTGWANASARGWIVRLFGVLYYPLITDKDSPFGHALGEVHGWLAWVLCSLTAAHIVAALFHRFVLRDDEFRRML